MNYILWFQVACIILFTSCSNGNDSASFSYELIDAFPGIRFERPVDFQEPGDGTDRIFVLEQQGRIFVFKNDPQVTQKTIFLDIRDQVNDGGNEEGLLGLAFHPQFESNGTFYLDYTASNPKRTVISQFQTDPVDSNKAVSGSQKIILEVMQPFSNHNGGQIKFGPDGFLYIALGDGGSAGDPGNNGQNPKTLLGSLLRIDVNNTQGILPYSIPPDNPFFDNNKGYREEIFAYGLRNPWRFSFDPVTGQLWTGDVGQNRYEEIDIIRKGGNYGWNLMEGFHTFRSVPGIDTLSLVMPVWEYSHDVGQSITGGFVYRGASLPDLIGAYIYADYVSGKIWSLRYDGSSQPQNQLLLETDLNIASFGVDSSDELYLCAFDGKIYQLKPAGGQ